jgi:HSP20 family protein
MDLVRREPFDGLNRIQARINELFQEALGQWRPFPAGPSSGWSPAVDILESRDSYQIRAELPGMKKEEITVEFRDGAVTLEGERKFDEPADGVQYHRGERSAGKFSRTFYLPQSVKRDEVKATYCDGILEVHIPKADEAKPKRVEIAVN